jgi:hypothetical protein
LWSSFPAAEEDACRPKRILAIIAAFAFFEPIGSAAIIAMSGSPEYVSGKMGRLDPETGAFYPARNPRPIRRSRSTAESLVLLGRDGCESNTRFPPQAMACANKELSISTEARDLHRLTRF